LGGAYASDGRTFSAVGIVFALSPGLVQGTWNEDICHFFAAAGDGLAPQAGLAFSSRGTVYGTTSGGGSHGHGAVFEAACGGSKHEQVVYSFTGQDGDGANPQAAVAVTSDGAIYGTTHDGGAYGSGTLFKLIPPGSPGGAWSRKVLASFGQSSGGAFPYAGPVVESHGALFGTTWQGGSANAGTVFDWR